MRESLPPPLITHFINFFSSSRSRFVVISPLTNQDPDALLLFSGGQTRADAGPGISEGASYYTQAEVMGMFEGHGDVVARTAVEEFAKDR